MDQWASREVGAHVPVFEEGRNYSISSDGCLFPPQRLPGTSASGTRRMHMSFCGTPSTPCKRPA